MATLRIAQDTPNTSILMLSNNLSNRIMRRQMQAWLSKKFKSVQPKPKSVNAGQCGLLDARQSGWYRKNSGELIEGFQIVSDDTLLDVGCGDGPASRFAAGCGAAVIAADIDSEKIDIVRRKLQKSKARSFEGIVTDSSPIPMADETVTKVVAMEVMEHVPDPANFLSELVRVGQPNAQYLITVPDPVAENIQQKIAPPAYWASPNHLHIFRRDELDQLIQDAGLQIERRTRYSFYWSMWWIFFWAADQEFGEPEAPLLANWTATWHELISSNKGEHVREALDDFMPKSQVIVARKVA
jgi:2-polyprenyl-3-methyl-5-hydroxy-6-metoxy-1,4-benzoquinol methylase